MSSPHRFMTPTPLWPRLVRLVYRLLLVLILLAGAYYILIYAHGIRESGSPIHGGEHVVPQHEDGAILYITAKQQIELNIYGAALAVSLLTWLLLGILMEFKLKIHVFRPVPAPLPREPKRSPPTSFSSN